MLISLISVIISQCPCISKHQVVLLKYIKFLFANYTTIMLGGKEISFDLYKWSRRKMCLVLSQDKSVLLTQKSLNKEVKKHFLE